MNLNNRINGLVTSGKAFRKWLRCELTLIKWAFVLILVIQIIIVWMVKSG